jgi:pimeloyl-ACP methyl ester carboxylesterase
VTKSTDEGLHVEVHDGAGPPILIVHGFLGGRALWLANVEALRAVASPVVVELYGHGRSPSPFDPRVYSPDAYVAAFEQIRSALGVERWYVFGQSLGAALTLRYVFDHPEAVIAHAFTNSASALADSKWRAETMKNVEPQSERIIEHGVGHLVQSRVNPARSHRVIAEVRHALAADEALLAPLGIARTLRYTVPPSSVRERVGENTRPALLVIGTKEKVFAEPSRYAEATMPNLTVARVDAGHSPNAETPDEFNKLITAFIAKHDEGRTI